MKALSISSRLARLWGKIAQGAWSWTEIPPMQYLLMIYEDESVYGPDKDGAAMAEVVAKHMALGPKLGAARLGGAGLQNTPKATTVRTTGGKQTVHDGPFAETKEQLGGYYLVEAPDLDAAVEIARQIPLYKDGAIEVRPLLGQGERKAG
jgi:hypothetical protein